MENVIVKNRFDIVKGMFLPIISKKIEEFYGCLNHEWVITVLGEDYEYAKSDYFDEFLALDEMTYEQIEADYALRGDENGEEIASLEAGKQTMIDLKKEYEERKRKYKAVVEECKIECFNRLKQYAADRFFSPGHIIRPFRHLEKSYNYYDNYILRMIKPFPCEFDELVFDIIPYYGLEEMTSACRKAQKWYHEFDKVFIEPDFYNDLEPDFFIAFQKYPKELDNNILDNIKTKLQKIESYSDLIPLIESCIDSGEIVELVNILNSKVEFKKLSAEIIYIMCHPEGNIDKIKERMNIIVPFLECNKESKLVGKLISHILSHPIFTRRREFRSHERESILSVADLLHNLSNENLTIDQEKNLFDTLTDIIDNLFDAAMNYCIDYNLTIFDEDDYGRIPVPAKGIDLGKLLFGSSFDSERYLSAMIDAISAECSQNRGYTKKKSGILQKL